MSNLAHTNDCLTYMYLRSGDNVSSPDFAANALLYLNLAQRELAAGTCRLFPQIVATFPWAKSVYPKTLTLIPSSTGTVTLTQNSTAITFSSGPAATVANYLIKFGTNETTYRITAHTAASTSATLDSECISASGSSSYTLFKVDYTIGSADILRLISVLHSYIDPSLGGDSYELIAETENDFRRYFPTFSSGTPTHFTELGQSEGTFTLRFNKYLSSTAYHKLEAPYIPIPTDLTASDLSIPIVPKHHRQTLCELALYFLLQDKGSEPSDVQAVLQSAVGGYSAMLKEIGQQDITFRPFKPNEEAKSGAI